MSIMSKYNKEERRAAAHYNKIRTRIRALEQNKNRTHKQWCRKQHLEMLQSWYYAQIKHKHKPREVKGGKISSKQEEAEADTYLPRRTRELLQRLREQDAEEVHAPLLLQQVPFEETA